jgi:hypothetical protein
MPKADEIHEGFEALNDVSVKHTVAPVIATSAAGCFLAKGNTFIPATATRGLPCAFLVVSMTVV